jgi:hypothetical protein
MSQYHHHIISSKMFSPFQRIKHFMNDIISVATFSGLLSQHSHSSLIYHHSFYIFNNIQVFIRKHVFISESTGKKLTWERVAKAERESIANLPEPGRPW